MNLRISDPKIEKLAQELANQTGETLEEAVSKALEERLKREAEISQRLKRIEALLAELDKMPVLDDRPADEIIGYNEYGTFD